MDHLIVLLQQAALAAAGLLPLINPVGAAPIFLSMTPGASEQTRETLARHIARNGWLLLAASMLVGSYVLSFFGLSLAIVKIAGGLLVIVSGWHLVSADQTPDAKTLSSAPVWDEAEVASQEFYPLTFPLTIGPGSVSVAMTLGAQTRAHRQNTVLAIIGTLLGLLIVCVVVYACFRFAGRLVRRLGPTGTIVLLRLSAFVLLCVGVQIFSDGLSERFPFLSGAPR